MARFGPFCGEVWYPFAGGFWLTLSYHLQVFCIAPVVISMTMPGGLSTWLCSILPASGTSIQASILYALTDFQFLSLGGLAIWTPYAMMGACVIEIPLFAFLSVRSYCRHTVN